MLEIDLALNLHSASYWPFALEQMLRVFLFPLLKGGEIKVPPLKDCRD